MNPNLVALLYLVAGGLLFPAVRGGGALYAPSAFGIGGVGRIPMASLIEMSLGAAIGAVTFTGSVIAFLKLSGRMGGAPILLPARHLINIALAAGIVASILWFAGSQGPLPSWD